MGIQRFICAQKLESLREPSLRSQASPRNHCKGPFNAFGIGSGSTDTPSSSNS